jgi:hypothetical protein
MTPTGPRVLTRRRRLIPLALTAVCALASCRPAPGPLAASTLPACGQVAISQVLDHREVRLADGRLVELVMPQLFLQTPSLDQPDLVALNQALVAYLKAHLDGRTVSADLADGTLSLCGRDLVVLGTGLVSDGLLYMEQVNGSLDPDAQATWRALEDGARQHRLGLWKKGDVGAVPFDRVARLTFRSLPREQTLDEITFNGQLSGRGGALTPEQLDRFHAVVASSAIVLLPRSPNFWRLCCDVTGSWYRIYYPRRADDTQSADYIDSPDLETFFRQVYADTSGESR